MWSEIEPLCWLGRILRRHRRNAAFAYLWMCCLERPRAMLCVALLLLYTAHPSLSTMEVVSELQALQADVTTLSTLFKRHFRSLRWWQLLLVCTCILYTQVWVFSWVGALCILAVQFSWDPLRKLHQALFPSQLIVECQRWWLGIGWQPCTLRSDPPPLAHWPSLKALPACTATPVIDLNFTDSEGWQYGDTSWSHWQNTTENAVTRRRFWKTNETLY